MAQVSEAVARRRVNLIRRLEQLASNGIHEVTIDLKAWAIVRKVDTHVEVLSPDPSHTVKTVDNQ